MNYSALIFSSFSEIEAGFIGPPFDGKNDSLSLDFPHVIWKNLTQVHGTQIVEAQEKNSIADGIYTKIPLVGCSVLVADCIAGLFYNPLTKEVAAVHAGWRGLAQKIFTSYLQKFEDVSAVRVALSPSLGVCCSEFSDPYHETPSFFHPFIIQKEGKYFVDLWKIAKEELLQCGILEKNIEMPLCCTKCSAGQWWSHRNKHKERNIGYIFISNCNI